MGAVESSINGIMFPCPSPPSYETPEQLRNSRLVVTGDGRRIVAVVAPASARRQGDTARQGWLVLYSHGNAEDLGSVEPLLEQLADRTGATFASYDYAGYGASEGTPSESAVLEDARAVAEAMVREGFPRSKTVLLGRSLGSGPTCFLASEAFKSGDPYRGVFLQSPFLSAFRVVLPSSMHWMSVPGDKFTNYERVRRGGFGCPVRVIHGEKDEVIDVQHGRSLARAVEERHRVPPTFVPDAGHNDVEHVLKRTGKPIHVHLLEFLDLVEKTERDVVAVGGVEASARKKGLWASLASSASSSAT